MTVFRRLLPAFLVLGGMELVACGDGDSNTPDGGGDTIDQADTADGGNGNDGAVPDTDPESDSVDERDVPSDAADTDAPADGDAIGDTDDESEVGSDSGDAALDVNPDTEDASDALNDSGDVLSPSLPNLIVTEFMLASCEAEAGAAQWIEILNVGTAPASLNGLVIADGAGGTHRVNGFTDLAPGGNAVLGANADTGANGGVDVDYVFSGLDFALPSGVVTIATDTATLFELDYDFSGVPSCTSLALSGDMLTPAAAVDIDQFCASTTLYNLSDRGTPGDANPACETPDTEVDWCRLQFPLDIDVLPGAEQDAYVRVYNDGTTTLSGGTDDDPVLRVELGVGPDGDLPSTDAWSWSTATANGSWTDSTEPGNDEFQAVLVAPAVPGNYDFAFRASRNDGATWLYCDRSAGLGSDGAENGYQAANAGSLHVRDLCAEAECEAFERVSCDGATRVRTSATGECTIVEGVAICSETVEVVDTCEAPTACTAMGELAFCLADQDVSGTCATLENCSADRAADCTGEVANSYTPARCDLSNCVYQIASTDCGESGDVCVDGACVTPSIPVGYCVVQFPKEFTLTPGGEADVYGRVYIEGITDQSTSNDLDERVRARVGVGSVGTSPETDDSWRWTNADPNSGYTATDEPNNDEYVAVLSGASVAASVGTRLDVAFSVSTNGGETWFYCDRNGGGARAYDASQAASLTIVDDL